MLPFQNQMRFTAGDVLSLEAVIWLQTIIDAFAAQQAEIAALEARIEALEP